MLLGGCILLTLFGIYTLPKVGIYNFAGFEAHAKHGSISMLRYDKTVRHIKGIPWYAVLLGYPVLGIWYWFTDQTIVQRALELDLREMHAWVQCLPQS